MSEYRKEGGPVSTPSCPPLSTASLRVTLGVGLFFWLTPATSVLALSVDTLERMPANPTTKTQLSKSMLTNGAFVTEDNEVIVAVYLRRKDLLTDAMVAYVQGNDLLVPLEELMLLLEFPIRETDRGAKGWFVAENRKFFLDLDAQKATVRGKIHKFSKGEAKHIDGELFVSVRRLSQWLPIDFRANFRGLTLAVVPREALPVDKKFTQSRKKFGGTYQFRSTLPRHHQDYALAQIPTADVDLLAGYSSRSGSRTFSAGSIRAFGDFLYMNGDLFVTGNHNKVTNARIRLGRTNPEGGLLGPLNASSYAIGDVGSPSVPLVARTSTGRGARITSRINAGVAEFDRITLEGNLEANYEVELYRNDILINAQRPGQGRQAGRYLFENVQLFRGKNDIRLEFYGPQGQRRTETKSYNINGGRVPVGKLNYDVAVQEMGRTVFGVRDLNHAYAGMSLGGVARFDYGLTRDISLTTSFVASPVPLQTITNQLIQQEEDYRYYATFGLRTQYEGIALSFDSAVDNKKGVALGFGAQTRWKNWDLSLIQKTFLNGFESQQSNLSNYTSIDRRRTSLAQATVRTRFTPFSGVHVGVGFGTDHTLFDNGDANWSLRNSLNISAGFLSLSNTVRYNFAEDTATDQFDGSAHVNLRVLNNISLRGSIQYGVSDYGLTSNNNSLYSVSAGLSTILFDDVNFSMGYSKNLARDIYSYDHESYYASLKRDFGWVALGLQGGYTDHENPDIDAGYNVALSASFSLFTDPETLSTSMTSKRIARHGAVRVNAYSDHNMNGVRDEDEPLIAKSKVLIASSRSPYYTGDDNNIPDARRISSGGWVDLALDKTALPGGILSPGSQGAAILPRPGVVTTVDLPVIQTADIEGSVQIRTASNTRPMPNVTVQLVRKGADGKTQIVSQIATEFDGVFVMSSVPVGKYTLRIDPEQAKRIGFKNPVVGKISLNHNTGLLKDVHINLDRERAVASLQLTPRSTEEADQIQIANQKMKKVPAPVFAKAKKKSKKRVATRKSPDFYSLPGEDE